MSAHTPRQSLGRPDVPWRRALVIALVALAIPGRLPWAAEVYKSIDAQGHVVYSDHPDTSVDQPADIGGSNPVSYVDMRSSEVPPSLLNDEQPPLPSEGVLWTPGYWAWDPSGYYWVPGAWVPPPSVGVLWTPGYWAYVDGGYLFHRGYWARQVGFYGGVNYGFGYFGLGFAGGRWVGHSFAYNTNVANVDAHVYQHTYRETVDNQAVRNTVSYNGGPGGTNSVPTAHEIAAAAQPHLSATPLQRQIMVQAARTPTLLSPTHFTPTTAVHSVAPPTTAALQTHGTTPVSAPTRSIDASRAASPRVAVHPPTNTTTTVSPRSAAVQPKAPTRVTPTHATPMKAQRPVS